MAEVTLESIAERLAKLESQELSGSGELTLESLAERLAKLERQQVARTGVTPPTRPLASVIGMFKGSAFMKQVDAEIEAMRAAEQKEIDEGGER